MSKGLVILALIMIAVLLKCLCFSKSVPESFMVYRGMVLEDGSIVCVGTRAVGRNYDGFVLRLSPDGHVLWAVAVGGSGYESFRDCILSSKNTIWAIGYTTSYGNGSYDVFLVELSLNGSVLRAFAVGGEEADIGQSLVEAENGLIVVGYTSSYGVGGYDLFFFRISGSGDIVWAKALGEMKYDDVGREICKAPDGGYLIVGDTWGFGVGMNDFMLVKLNEHGYVEWVKTIGGGGYDEADRVLVLDDGYLITGASWSYGYGYDDAFIVRTDLKGEVVWALSVGGEEHDVAHEAIWCNGSYVVVGATSSFGGGDYDCFVVVVEEGGNISRGVCFGGKFYEAGHMIFSINGEYVVVGYSSSLRKNFRDVLIATLSLNLSLKHVYLFESSGAEDGICPQFALIEESGKYWNMWARKISVKSRAQKPYVSYCKPVVTDLSKFVSTHVISMSSVEVTDFKTSIPPRPIFWLRDLKLFVKRNFAFLLLLVPCIVVALLILWLKLRRR